MIRKASPERLEAKQPAEIEDRELDVIQATIESVADAVIVVSPVGEVLTFNQSFVSLWRIPEQVIASRESRRLIDFALDQVVDRSVFTKKILQLYANPEKDYFDLVKLKDGRVLERYSKPLRIGNEIRGLVLSYREITSRIRTERALRENELKFRRISESNLIGIVSADFPGKITEANDYFLNLLGYTRAELEAGLVRWTEFTPPEFHKLDEEAIHALRTSGTYPPFEKQFIRKDGTRVTVLVGGALLDGSREEAASFVLDVSAHKDAEKALKLSEERFRAIFQSAPIAIAVADLNGALVEVNPHLQRMTGYTADELRILGFQAITHPDDRGLESRRFAELIAGSIDCYTMEKRYIRKDGRVIWGDLIVTLGRDNERKPLFVLGIAENITQRKGAMDSLLKSEEQYRSLYVHTPVMMHSIDSEGRLVSVSDCWLETLGYRREEVLGRKSVDFMTSESRNYAVTTALPQYFRVGTCKDIPYQFVKKNGSLMDILLSAIAEKDENGKITRSLAVLIDVTERKRAETERNRLLVQEREARIEAQKAAQLRDDFIAIASHELRTPITPLKMQVQLIIRHLRSGIFSSYPRVHELLKVLDTTLQQLDHLSKLIEDMLTVSRISAGRLVLNTAEADLSELVHDVIARFRREVEAAGCSMSIHLEPGIRGDWDRALIDQVIVNLLTNAIKYGRSKPVEISVSSDRGNARLEVRDQGIGIAREEQEKIFDRFERFVSIREFGGFGLGLYITRQIVNAHGGTIRVESEPGKGSTFIAELPLRAEKVQPSPAKAA